VCYGDEERCQVGESFYMLSKVLESAEVFKILNSGLQPEQALRTVKRALITGIGKRHDNF
jgi:hypothetical protein